MTEIGGRSAAIQTVNQRGRVLGGAEGAVELARAAGIEGADDRGDGDLAHAARRGGAAHEGVLIMHVELARTVEEPAVAALALCLPERSLGLHVTPGDVVGGEHASRV